MDEQEINPLFLLETKKMCKSFYLKDVVNLADNYFLFYYSDKKTIINNKKPDTYNYFILGGFGDILIHIPILYDLQKKYANTGIKFKLITGDEKKSQLIRYFLPETDVRTSHCAIFSEKTDTAEIFETFLNYKTIPQGSTDDIFQNKDFFDTNFVINSIYEMICRRYDPSDEFTSVKLLNSYKKYFDNYRKNFKIFPEKESYYIGVQRTSKTSKYLPWEFMNTFISLCHQNNIKVINIDPNEEYKDHYDYDYSYLSLNETFDLLSGVNAFIGIDSCFGHACALLNVPNLICFSSTFIADQAFGPNFKPISNNYSFVAKVPEHPSFNVYRIFVVLQDIIHKRLILLNEFTPTADLREFYDYEFHT